VVLAVYNISKNECCAKAIKSAASRHNKKNNFPYFKVPLTPLGEGI
jgi:hypothetical protein